MMFFFTPVLLVGTLMTLDALWARLRLRARQLGLGAAIVGTVVAYTCILICAIHPDGCGKKICISNCSHGLVNTSSGHDNFHVLVDAQGTNKTIALSGVGFPTNIDRWHSLSNLHTDNSLDLTVTTALWENFANTDTLSNAETPSVTPFNDNSTCLKTHAHKPNGVKLNTREDDGPAYNSHILCIGQKLLDGIKTQDDSLLKESQFTDDTIVEKGIDWEYPRSYAEGLGDFIWGGFVKEYFPDPKDRPKPVVVDWAGPVGRNFGTMFQSLIDAPRGILVASNMFVKRTAPQDIPHRASDIIFLQWMRIAKKTEDVGNIKWILIQLITNLDTIQVLEQACPGKDLWPGCLFDPVEKPRDSAAILGTPNGRFVGWMLLNRPDELPRRTIKSIRAFTGETGLLDDGWNLIFEIGILPDEVASASSTTKGDGPTSKGSAPTGQVLVQPREIEVTRKHVPLQKRKTVTECACTGKSILQLLKTQENLPPSQFTDYDSAFDPGNFSVGFQQYESAQNSWQNALEAWGVPVHGDWLRWHCSGKKGGLADGASYSMYIHVESGTIMRTMTFRADENNEAKGVIYKPSDFIFLAWKEACRRKGGDVAGLKRILVDSITNPDTKGVMVHLVFEKRLMFPPFPTWPGYTAEAGSEDMDMLLGTPNAVSVGWILINRNAELPRMTVASIQFFDGTISPNMAVILGPLEIEAGEVGGAQPSGGAGAASFGND